MQIGTGQASLLSSQSSLSSSPALSNERKKSQEDVPDETPSLKKAHLEQTHPKKACGPTYEAFFVDDDHKFNALAGHLLNQQRLTGQRLSVVQCPEDLHQGSLFRELRIDANGVPHSSDGLLFNGSPVTLLIDFRQFPPESIPELNELFEKPARLEGRRLGNNVRIVTVISPDMLPTSENAQNSPGPDFWWRINGACPPQPASDITGADSKGSLQTWLDHSIIKLDDSLEVMETGAATTVIDFTGQDWHGLLFGAPGLDEKGQLAHQPGALEGLPEGQVLILKNAPWHDQAFTVQLAQALQSGTFRRNGSEARLPTNLKLYQQPLSQDDIQAIAREIQWAGEDGSAPGQVDLINKDNFAQVMQDNVLTQDGKVCRRDMLAHYLKGSDGIRITSALTTAQWLQLVSRLRQAGLAHLPFFTDVPKEQPAFFRGSQTGTNSAVQPMMFTAGKDATWQVSIERCKGNSQLPLSASGSVEEFVILPEQSLTKIAQRTETVSLRNRAFNCQLTQLIQCLRDGTPVCLSGLQSNPVLLRQLETLLCSPPYLVLFGQRETFPDMRLTITWPESRTMPSPVWQAFANTNEQDAEVKGEAIMETDTHHQALTRFKQLYDTLSQLRMATYCPAEPPADIQPLFQKVLRQAESEQQMDGCGSLQPGHIYQAVNSVVLKEYRANREVYSYLKQLNARLFLPDEPADWMDQESLQTWLAKQPLFDREVVKKQFWSLTRAFPATMFPNQQVPDDTTVDELLALLVILSGKGNARLVLQYQKYTQLPDEALSAAENRLAGLRNRSLQREKTFYNRLVSLDSTQRQAGSLREQAQWLAAAELQDGSELDKALDGILSEKSRTDDGLRQDLKAPQHDWHSWEQRRIRRLAEKVRHNPVVFIKGETGAGKSYIAEEVAHTLNPDQPPRIITVGPETELSDLLGRQVLKPADNAMETDRDDGNTDLQTQYQPAPLTLWARQESNSNQPVVLIIDEANLAIPELWNCLKGLYEEQPCLYTHGERIPLSPNHRIIMTGNPDHFSGRRMNELLRTRAPQLYYQPLDPAFIREKVLRRGLTEVLAGFMNTDKESNTLKSHVDQLVSAIELLFPHYQKLLPGRVFTPRDLTDLISRIQATLIEHKADHTTSDELTVEGLNGLVWQAFKDTLGCEVSKQKQIEKEALKIWYGNQRPWNKSLTQARKAAFNRFYSQWQIEQGKHADSVGRLDYSNKSTHRLMRHIWLEQRRSQQEKETSVLHRGRHATVISGPAGRGKSAMLDQQLTSMCLQAGQPPPLQINAGHSSWERLQQAISDAKQQGYPLIISELNLLKSEEIEGLLNNAITGQSTPGFHLYTTVNPASFVGRHRFSPALKNRFTCLGLSEYTDQDIHTIAHRVLPTSLSTAQQEQVINWHLRLRHYLKQKKVPLQPAVADLQRLGDILTEQYPHESLTADQLRATFIRQYNLFLMAGKCTLDQLPALPDTVQDTKAWKDQVKQQVQVLNNIGLARPVVPIIVPEAKKVEALSPSHIVVPTAPAGTLDVNKTRQEVKLALALLSWEQQSQGQQCPCAHDTLYSACYRLWQQNFIDSQYGLPRALIPLSPEQQATLEHPDNQSLLNQVRIQFSQPPTPRGLELLRETLGLPGEEGRVPEQMEVSGQPLRQETAIKIKGPEKLAETIDNKTKERVVTNYTVNQTFKDFHPISERIGVWKLEICGSQVKQETLPAGSHGYDIVCPELLRQPVYTMGEEQYGVVQKRLSTDYFIELPGLYAHQTITRLRTHPAIPLERLEVVRDRGTGQLLMRLKDPKDYQLGIFGGLQVHYVVKRVQPSASAEENLPVSTRSSLNALIDEATLKQFSQTRPDALMEALAAWARDFNSDQDVSGSSGTDTLAAIIRQRQGTCRHRAWAVYAIAAARGVPVRLVTSVLHAWIEYSADRGRTWKKIDLGGTGADDAPPVINRPDFSESASGLMFSPQEQEAFLQDALSDPEGFAGKMGTTISAVIEWLKSGGKAPLATENAFNCFYHLLLSGLSGNLQKAREMVQSGQIDDRQFSENSEMLTPIFAHLLQSKSTQAECEPVLELIYEMKGLVKSTKNLSATQEWLKFLRHVDRYLMMELTYKDPLFYRKLRHQQIFAFWSYGILKKNLLSGLTMEAVYSVHRKVISTLEYLSEGQRKTALPEVMAKLEAFFEPYYLSIKAPARQGPQSVAGGTANTEELKGSSPSFEQRLKTTDIGSGYSWLPEGTLVIDRLLRQRAPFREQKASVSTRKVKLIQNNGGVLYKKGYRDEIQTGLTAGVGFFNVIKEELKPQFSAIAFQNAWIDIGGKAFNFSDNPTQDNRIQLQTAIENNGLTITPTLSDFLNKYIKGEDKVKSAARALPQSFAGYLAKHAKADRGNLGLYGLLEDETRRGYRSLASKEDILEADAQEGPFLLLPPAQVKKHLQKEDSESLFVDSYELQHFIEEYCEHLRLDDL